MFPILATAPHLFQDRQIARRERAFVAWTTHLKTCPRVPEHPKTTPGGWVVAACPEGTCPSCDHYRKVWTEAERLHTAYRRECGLID